MTRAIALAALTATLCACASISIRPERTIVRSHGPQLSRGVRVEFARDLP